jgi:hypothetical protein
MGVMVFLKILGRVIIGQGKWIPVRIQTGPWGYSSVYNICIQYTYCLFDNYYMGFS